MLVFGSWSNFSRHQIHLRAIIGLLLLFSLQFDPGEACLCHVVPNFSCPPPPHCCESGQYTFDECGCCLTCAKAELQACGGPNDSSGKCSKDLACLKTCTACKTIGFDSKPCVFPFIYEGETFDTCTSKDASEGSVWCATAVNETGHVIEGRWGDCKEGCPGARRECNDLRFAILVGKCINPDVPGAIPNWFGAPPYQLLDKTKDLFDAPLCQSSSHQRRRQYKNTCRCSEGQDSIEIGSNGLVRGNCTGFDIKKDNIDTVWCFLENIRDPNDPTSGCYDDTTWSPSDGRFWSAKACQGIPEIGNDINSDKSKLPLGPRHPLFQAALSKPFRRPEDIFEDLRTTLSPATSRPRPPKRKRPRNRGKNRRPTTRARPLRPRTTTTTTTTTTSTTTSPTTTTTTTPLPILPLRETFRFTPPAYDDLQYEEENNYEDDYYLYDDYDYKDSPDDVQALPLFNAEPTADRPKTFLPTPPPPPAGLPFGNDLRNIAPVAYDDVDSDYFTDPPPRPTKSTATSTTSTTTTAPTTTQSDPETLAPFTALPTSTIVIDSSTVAVSEETTELTPDSTSSPSTSTTPEATTTVLPSRSDEEPPTNRSTIVESNESHLLDAVSNSSSSTDSSPTPKTTTSASPTSPPDEKEKLNTSTASSKTHLRDFYAKTKSINQFNTTEKLGKVISVSVSFSSTSKESAEEEVL